MRALHANFAYLVIASNLAVGVWGMVLWRRQGVRGSSNANALRSPDKKTAPRAFWITLAAAWATIYIQGILGLTLFERYKSPFKHHFYGFLFVIVTLLVFPLRSEQPRRRLLVFSAATLFIGIVAVRATLSL